MLLKSHESASVKGIMSPLPAHNTVDILEAHFLGFEHGMLAVRMEDFGNSLTGIQMKISFTTH